MRPRRQSEILEELAAAVTALSAATLTHTRAIEYHAVQLKRVFDDHSDPGLEDTSMELVRSALGLGMAQQKVAALVKKLA